MASNMNGIAIATLVGAWTAAALDVYSTFNSSPQTTELFASDRADSLLHWVMIGDAVALGGGLAGSIISKSPWPLISTAVVAAGLHFSYMHAVRRGIDQPPPANAG